MELNLMTDEEMMLDNILKFINSRNTTEIHDDEKLYLKEYGINHDDFVNGIQKLIHLGYVGNKTNTSGTLMTLTEKGRNFYIANGFKGQHDEWVKERKKYDLDKTIKKLTIDVHESTLTTHKFQKRGSVISMIISGLALIVSVITFIYTGFIKKPEPQNILQQLQIPNKIILTKLQSDTVALEVQFPDSSGRGSIKRP